MSVAEIKELLSNAVAEFDEAREKIERLQQWVNDLQSGMYINCVYCGHRYGPKEGTPVAMTDVLKAHIEQCPQHPLSHAMTKIVRLESIIHHAVHWIESDTPVVSFGYSLPMGSHDDFERLREEAGFPARINEKDDEATVQKDSEPVPQTKGDS